MVEFEPSVVGVTDAEGLPMPLLTGSERNLAVGWRNVDGGVMVTQNPNTSVYVELEDTTNQIETTPLPTFNDLNYSVTIVGHHTTNLFRWTQDFSGTELVFTWLIERPFNDEVGWKLPLLAMTMLIAVPISIVYLLRADQFSASNNQEH